MEETKEMDLTEQKSTPNEETEDKEKKKNPQVTIKFSDEAMYDDVVDYLNKYKNYNGTKIPNGTLIARAVKHYTESSKVNEAIEILPDALTNVFTGGGDAIEVAITAIRNTFATLTTTTATAVDERESKVRKHYEKRISSLEKNIETLEASAKANETTKDYLRNKLHVAQTEQDRAESEAKSAHDKIQSLEVSLKDKDQLIVSLEDAKKTLMEQSASKDAELSELRQEVKELSDYKSESITQLKLKDQEVSTLRNEEERLKSELDSLKTEISALRSEHKEEITELKNESKQALAELKTEHKEEMFKLKSDMDLKNEALVEENKNLSSQLKEAQAKINELYEQLMKTNQKSNEEK